MFEWGKDAITFLLKKAFEYIVVALAVAGIYFIYQEYSGDIDNGIEHGKQQIREEAQKELNNVFN